MSIFPEKIPLNHLLFEAFPNEYQEDLKNVLAFLMNYKFDVHSIVFHKIEFQGNELCIPYRLYFDIDCKAKIIQFSQRQQALFWCIASRQDDGFIREEAVKQLFKSDEKIAKLFALILASEYIKEIIEIINLEINENNINDFLEILYEDKSLFSYIKGNVASHWGESIKNEYPEEKRHYKQYAGKELITKLNKGMAVYKHQ